MRLGRFVVALLAGVCTISGCTSSAGEDSGDPQPAGHTHAPDGSPATLLVGDGTQAVEIEVAARGTVAVQRRTPRA